MAFRRKTNRKNAKKKFGNKKKVCRYCADKKLTLDYKDARALSPYLTERGRLIPRRVTGNCLRHQREVTLAVKRARVMSFIPFTATHAVGSR